METLQKKYGLWTAIAMVVGVVIGSGIFFKADDVLVLTNGNLQLALLAWIIGAFSMIFGTLVFAEFAQRIEKANGIVDYTEEAYGERFGYLVGWFKGTVYYSPISAILAWVSAMYTLILIGIGNPQNSPLTWGIACLYLIALYLLNYYSPLLSGKFQLSTTVIKLIPLFLVGVVGLVYGLYHEVLIDNFTTSTPSIKEGKGSLTSAIVATAFAFEGWIVATTINNEIKDAKKNLPKALVIGAIIIFVVYVSYFMGISGTLKTEKIIELSGKGIEPIDLATKVLFGQFASKVLIVFVVMSCLGTLNGLVISCTRTPYSLAIRKQGPFPKLIAKVNPKTNMPPFASLYALLLSVIYLVIWYGSWNNWFGQFISIDEIPIVLIYGLYIFLYIWYMTAFKDLNPFKRYVIPSLAIIGSLIIVYGGITNPKIGIYLLISLVITGLGLVFYRSTDETT